MAHGVRCMRTRGFTSSRRWLRVRVLVLVAIDAFEIGEGLGVSAGVGFGRFAASEVGKGEADVEQSSDAT